MKTFRIVASKNNNKVTLVNQYDSLEEARSDIGRQGYAIIEIGELKEGMTLEGIFYFEIQTSDGIRKGKIKSDDIFKAYIKLVDDLGYKVLFIYDRVDATDEYKKLMTVNIEKSYIIYQEQAGKKKKTITTDPKEKDASENFAAKKEIERLHIVYAKMLTKAETLLNTYREDLSSDVRNDLGDIINHIKTIGSISNIDRLRAFGEESLRKIGAAEISIINKRSIHEKKAFLEETNKLLKGVGSHKAVTHEDDSILGSLKKIFEPLLARLKSKKTPLRVVKPNISLESSEIKQGATHKVVKKGSYLYYHVLKDIESYKKKKRIIFREWLHALFRLDSEGIRSKKIKLGLITQNIRLLNARLSGRTFSYTKIIQGVHFYLRQLLVLIQGFANLYITVFAVVTAYFATSYAFASFFQKALFLRPSFFFLLVVAAAGAVTIKACSRLWHLVPAALVFGVFVLLLQINF